MRSNLHYIERLSHIPYNTSPATPPSFLPRISCTIQGDVSNLHYNERLPHIPHNVCPLIPLSSFHGSFCTSRGYCLYLYDIESLLHIGNTLFPANFDLSSAAPRHTDFHPTKSGEYFSIIAAGIQVFLISTPRTCSPISTLH